MAVVGDQVITREDYRAELDRRARSDPAKYGTAQAQRELLDEMIQFEAAFAKARAAGYEQKPQIAASIKRLIVARYREDQLGQTNQPALRDREIEAYYQANLGRYRLPETRKGALIFMRVPAMATDEKKTEARQRAEHLRSNIVANAGNDLTFGQWAQRHSEDQATRYRGGDMGWVRQADPAGQWEESIVAALFALERPGEISPVLTTATGHYLVRLTEIKATATRSLAEVRDSIAYQLGRAQEQNQARQFAAQQLA
ncbi:MAG: peptidylprolyl isomerase, partial [Desulfobacterales bacterium]|nr:peptidylprolyl isomerase [Desulfobacterales bacterium]